jgi:site-specific recombinase XerD
MLGQVISLANDAPGLTDAQLRDRLTALTKACTRSFAINHVCQAPPASRSSTVATSAPSTTSSATTAPSIRARNTAEASIRPASISPSTARSESHTVTTSRMLDCVLACEGVRLPEVSKKEVQIPSLAVLDALRETLPERFQAVVDLVAGSGLRQGEVFGLEVDGLDFLRTRSVDVHQQLITLANQAPYLDEPKSVESCRVVPLAQVTLNALAAHPPLYPARTVTITDRTDPRKPVEREARLVFTLDDGTPVARHTWSGIWAPVAKATRLPARTGLHVLRHLYASLLIRHGESVKTVQKRLGHSSAAITLDTYAHVWPDADDRTQDALAPKIDDAADNLRTGDGS